MKTQIQVACPSWLRLNACPIEIELGLNAKGNSLHMVEKSGNRWIPKEDDLLRRMAEANIHPDLIATKLNRSVHAIKARAYAIGLPLKWFKLKAKVK
jgi:hypothetical protein